MYIFVSFSFLSEWMNEQYLLQCTFDNKSDRWDLQLTTVLSSKIYDYTVKYISEYDIQNIQQ